MIGDEQAKAIQAVAKTTEKFAEIAEKVGGFVSKVIGPASDQVGGILEDWTRFYRYKNLLSIADKVEIIHARRKIEGQTIPIPPRVAIPMLESASLEDDETLQEVWARLIANSTDPTFKAALHPGYIDIIKQMSPDEAIILNSFLKLTTYPVFFSHHLTAVYEQADNIAMDYYWMMQNKESYNIIYEMYLNHCKTLTLIKSDDSRVYIDNLLRLRIVELGYDFSGKEIENPFFGRLIPRSAGGEKASILIPARDEYLRMTSFGQNFVAACIGDNNTGIVTSAFLMP
jgi:hypothetical protein